MHSSISQASGLRIWSCVKHSRMEEGQLYENTALIWHLAKLHIKYRTVCSKFNDWCMLCILSLYLRKVIHTKKHILKHRLVCTKVLNSIPFISNSTAESSMYLPRQLVLAPPHSNVKKVDDAKFPHLKCFYHRGRNWESSFQANAVSKQTCLLWSISYPASSLDSVYCSLC